MARPIQKSFSSMRLLLVTFLWKVPHQVFSLSRSPHPFSLFSLLEPKRTGKHRNETPPQNWQKTTRKVVEVTANQEATKVK